MLKDKDTNEVLFVVVFSLVGPEAIKNDDAKAGKQQTEIESGKDFQPSEDDVD